MTYTTPGGLHASFSNHASLSKALIRYKPVHSLAKAGYCTHPAGSWRYAHSGLLSTLSLFSVSPGLSRSQGPSPWRRRGHILGLPPVCLCDCHQEGRRTEEGALCAGHAGHETLSALRTKGAGLGCWPSEQPATELLLLWRSWGVSDEGCELGAVWWWWSEQGEGPHGNGGVVVVVEQTG